jgi:lysophospholipase L1-like esterase
MKKIVVVFLALALLAAGIHAQEQSLTRYESQIEHFEQLDRENPPKADGIVFAGSSTFVMWKTMAEDLKPLTVLNRGFGGSTYPELIHYAGRIIIPYRPKIVVVYEGDNDLAGPDADAAAVFKNFRILEEKIHSALPDTMLYFLSIKPSIARWDRWQEMRRANHMIADFMKGKKRLAYIDIVPAILGDEGKPRESLFADDNLHLNREGYRRIAEIIRPIIERQFEGTR